MKKVSFYLSLLLVLMAFSCKKSGPSGTISGGSGPGGPDPASTLTNYWILGPTTGNVSKVLTLSKNLN